MNSGLAETVAAVRTPLALVALLLILGAGLLRRLLDARRPNATHRAIVRYGFALSGVLGVLAFAAYVITSLSPGDVRISGAVRDEANHGVAGVSARVDGINGSTSDANGSFEFIVPARSKLRTYTLIVDGQGIEAAKVALDGPAPLPVTVTVRRVQPPAARIDLPPDIYVSHYVGLAHVQLALLVQNPTKDVVALSGVRLSLKSPSGDSYELTPEFFSLGEGTAWMPPPVTWHVPSSGPPFLVIMYFTIRSGDFEPLVNSVNKEFAARHLEGKLPTLGVSLLPPYLTQSLQTFMDSHFVWREGSWRATLRSFLDGKPVEVLADFTLDSSDIMAMRRIRQHYSTGIGVFWNVRFGVSPDTRSDRHVVLVVKK